MSGLKAKAGLLFFVCVGIFTGLVAFGNFIAPAETGTPAEKQDFSNTATATDSLQNVIGQEAPLPSETPAETAAMQAETGANLTQSLASLIGKNIVDRNPEGPAGENLTVMGADGMADAALAESMKRFNPAHFSPEISQGEIVIDEAQTAAAYRAAAAKIAADAESAYMPAAGDPVAVKMAAYAKRYGTEATGLRDLPAPPSLITEHLRAIRIATGRERILEAVADYDNDPIYAMLALKLWDTLK